MIRCDDQGIPKIVQALRLYPADHGQMLLVTFFDGQQTTMHFPKFDQQFVDRTGDMLYRPIELVAEAMWRSRGR